MSNQSVAALLSILQFTDLYTICSRISINYDMSGRFGGLKATTFCYYHVPLLLRYKYQRATLMYGPCYAGDVIFSLYVPIYSYLI